MWDGRHKCNVLINFFLLFFVSFYLFVCIVFDRAIYGQSFLFLSLKKDKNKKKQKKKTNMDA